MLSRRAFDERRLHNRFVDGVAIAAEVFRAVHRTVGRVHDACGVFTVVRRQGDADADADVGGNLSVHEGLRKCGDDMRSRVFATLKVWKG